MFTHNLSQECQIFMKCGRKLRNEVAQISPQQEMSRVKGQGQRSMLNIDITEIRPKMTVSPLTDVWNVELA